jgi:formylglycine-generating enzyme required for sulfatase activity
MELPASVGKYELLELLGVDSAEWYRGRNTETGRAVLVKILAAGAPSEAASVLDRGEFEGRPYVVLEGLPSPSPRVPVSPAPALIRLSIIVYAAVLVVTGLAVVTWLRVQPPPQVEGMIYIPAGTFLAGPDKHVENLKAFYIDATEVTNAEYSRFCRATGCAPPAAAPRLPVVNVSVAAARAYAQWSHKRLPSPLEWERAARGVGGALFPWGDAEDPSLANVSNNPTLAQHALMPARSLAAYPGLQMTGNAWEMVEGEAHPDAQALARFGSAPGERWISIRGGSYNVPLTPGILYDSVAIPERYTATDIGFRCVKDP